MYFEDGLRTSNFNLIPVSLTFKELKECQLLNYTDVPRAPLLFCLLIDFFLIPFSQSHFPITIRNYWRKVIFFFLNVSVEHTFLVSVLAFLIHVNDALSHIPFYFYFIPVLPWFWGLFLLLSAHLDQLLLIAAQRSASACLPSHPGMTPRLGTTSCHNRKGCCQWTSSYIFRSEAFLDIQQEQMADHGGLSIRAVCKGCTL